MGARSFDDEIAQVKSRDRANRYFAPNINTKLYYKTLVNEKYIKPYTEKKCGKIEPMLNSKWIGYLFTPQFQNSNQRNSNIKFY